MKEEQLALRNCIGVPTRVFYPEREYESDTSVAKAICSGCVVRLHCLEAGMKERHGVWGGLSEQERRMVRRKRRRAA